MATFSQTSCILFVIVHFIGAENALAFPLSNIRRCLVLFCKQSSDFFNLHDSYRILVEATSWLKPSPAPFSQILCHINTQVKCSLRKVISTDKLAALTALHGKSKTMPCIGKFSNYRTETGGGEGW